MIFPLFFHAGSTLISSSDHSDGDASVPSGMKYLAQCPPGREPVVFAPGIISETRYRLHGPVVFSPDLRQICWAVIPPSIMSVSLSPDGWSDPAPLELKGRVVQSPAFSADGKYLLYQAVGDNGTNRISIWKSQRTNDGWSAPSSIGENVNSNSLQSQPSLANNGTLYYTGTLKGVCFDRGIYRSRLIDGEYQKPELLCSSINSEYIDYCPWIAPDESYLLFASSRPRTEEPLNIYISFRNNDGSWSEPKEVHEAIGFHDNARFPSVSPDGKYLFFVSGNKAYWVDIAPVMELRNDQLL